jgi:drug/metabolite transporter (DMT)-like permease
MVGHPCATQSDLVILSSHRWIVLTGLYFHPIKQQWHNMKNATSNILLLALCGQVLFPLTLYFGLQYTTSLNAAIYLSTTPVLVLLINRWGFQESITPGNIAGVVLSSVGVVWLVIQGNFLYFSALRTLNRGEVWTMASAVSWALYCALLRLKPKGESRNVFVAVSAVVGVIMLLPVMILGLLMAPEPVSHYYTDSRFLTGLPYLVIFPSWLAYLFWNRGSRAIGTTRGEVFSHLIPLSGGVLSIFFLHVPLHLFHLISALLILCGLALCSVCPVETFRQEDNSQATRNPPPTPAPEGMLTRAQDTPNHDDPERHSEAGVISSSCQTQTE